MKNQRLDPTRIWQLTLLLVGILSIFGITLMIHITAIGPWAYSDSAAYITTARNIAAGRGIVLQDTQGVFTLLPLHAPLFPLALSLPIALGVDAVQAARWLNAILFGLTAFLVGWSTLRFTRSFWLSITAVSLFCLSIEPLIAFSGAMAEGLYLLWGFLSLFLVALAVQKGEGNFAYLAGGGVAAGLAILARYTGLAMLGTGLLAVFLFSPGNLWKRLKKMLIFLVPGSTIAAIWFIPVYFSTGTFGSRQVGSLEGMGAKLSAYFEVFYQLVGGWLPFFNRGNHILAPWLKLMIGLSILAGLIIFVSIKSYGKEKTCPHGQFRWGLILIIFSIGYTALHLSAFVTAEVQPDINGRLLVPLFIAGILLAPLAASYVSEIIAPRRWIFNLGFVALAGISIWYFHGPVKDYIFEMHNFGVGYTSERWKDNSIFQEIKNLEPEFPLASNSPALVLFYTERFPVSLHPDQDGARYTLNAIPKSALILFSDAGKNDLGEAYFPFIDGIVQQYDVFYDNDEGIVLLPE